MINQIQIASEPKDSNLASTVAHVTRKDKQGLTMFVLILVMICGFMLAGCGGCGGGNSSSNGANDDIESAEMPEFDETVAGFEKFMKQFVPRAEKMAKLQGDQAALMNEMAFVMEFQEYSRMLAQWMYWIEQKKNTLSEEDQAKVDKLMEPLKR